MNVDKKFQPFKNHVNNVVLGGQELPNNTLNAYKALQMSHKSYYNQQEPLNKNPLNQSKLPKPKKTEKNRKKPKKTSPKFEICGSVRFFWVATPPISTIYFKVDFNFQSNELENSKYGQKTGKKSPNFENSRRLQMD